jgi:hypothetical protein
VEAASAKPEEYGTRGGNLLLLADLTGESQLEPGTRLDEGVMLVERRVAQPHVVHGKLPGLVLGLIRTIPTWPRRLLVCGINVFTHAATEPIVRGGQEIPDFIIPFIHPVAAFRRARRRLHPFGCK